MPSFAEFFGSEVQCATLPAVPRRFEIAYMKSFAEFCRSVVQCATLPAVLYLVEAEYVTPAALEACRIASVQLCSVNIVFFVPRRIAEDYLH